MQPNVVIVKIIVDLPKTHLVCMLQMKFWKNSILHATNGILEKLN